MSYGFEWVDSVDQLGAGGSAIMAVSHIIIALLVSFVTISHSVIATNSSNYGRFAHLKMIGRHIH